MFPKEENGKQKNKAGNSHNLLALGNSNEEHK